MTGKERDKAEKGRVIVTYGRSLIALMIAQSLGSRGIDVIGCDDVDFTVTSFSKFTKKNYVYTLPEKDEEKFIDDLEKIIEKNRPGGDVPYVLMPVFDETTVIAKHKNRLEKLITVACPDYKAIERVFPKDHFAKTVIEHNIAAPRTWLPETQEYIEGHRDEFTFPLFIKPPDETGGRGISKVEDIKALKRAFGQLEKRYPRAQLIIQEAVKGRDYCYCGLFDKGRRLACMTYRNIQKYPRESGFGVVRETVESAPFNGIVDELMAHLKWDGVVEIDFLWNGDADSEPKIIEVNARFWAGLDHSVRSNIDFPYLLYQLFTAGTIEETQTADIGHKTRLPALSTIAEIDEIFHAALNFEELEKSWPDIKKHLQAQDIKRAGECFIQAMKASITIDEARKLFSSMKEYSKEIESISYAKDDPFIGLGALFVLGSLIRHGRLPPELQY